MTELPALATPHFVVAEACISRFTKMRARFGGCSGFQPRGMPAQMIAHEGGDEVIAVVVTGLAAQVERDIRLLASALQQFRAKLFGQERVGVAVVDQQIGKASCRERVSYHV